ncbi:MAG TPA: FUN14 domain-containing protein [Nitrososphaeraceae archaeon]|nr:FUN14 domain-containing protein [Nitrososphaeraceae archaeon]
MSETAAIEFLVVLIAPFMVAYGLGYFFRKSIKVIAFMFGMFFFVVGILWYAGVIDSYGAIQMWTEDVMKTSYNTTQELTGEIEKTMDAKADSSSSQMLIIVGISSFFTGMLFGLRGTSDKRGLRISAD